MPQLIIITVLLVCFILISVLYYFCPLHLLVICLQAGLKISPLKIISFRLRKINPYTIIEAAIKLHKAGIDIDIELLEYHVLGGGHIDKVVNVLIAAKKENREITFMDVCTLDLKGKL